MFLRESFVFLHESFVAVGEFKTLFRSDHCQSLGRHFHCRFNGNPGKWCYLLPVLFLISGCYYKFHQSVHQSGPTLINCFPIDSINKTNSLIFIKLFVLLISLAVLKRKPLKWSMRQSGLPGLQTLQTPNAERRTRNTERKLQTLILPEWPHCFSLQQMMLHSAVQIHPVQQSIDVFFRYKTPDLLL